MKDWYFHALVPNLRMQDAIGNEMMAMVPYEDPRLKKTAEGDDRLLTLLGRFTDQFGRKRFPSAIISRRASAPLPGADLIDFRNVVALSCLVGGAQHSMLVRPPLSSVSPVLHSDYFDLYPVFLPSDRKRAFLTSSYAGIGWDTDIDRFQGQVSPRLHNLEAARAIADGFVFDTLMADWMSLYVESRPVSNHVIRLFRSLQVAVHAAALLSRNEASIHDFGVCVSQWVSAIETLLHPIEGNIGKRHVLNALAKHPWRAWALRKTVKVLPATKEHAAVPWNAVQFLCHQLYKARNDFVHGNDLANAPYHAPLENMHGPGWLVVAPLIFKTALSCFEERYDAGDELENALIAVLEQSECSP